MVEKYFKILKKKYPEVKDIRRKNNYLILSVSDLFDITWLLNNHGADYIINVENTTGVISIMIDINEFKKVCGGD